jgi:hypothetical protein
MQWPGSFNDILKRTKILNEWMKDRNKKGSALTTINHKDIRTQYLMALNKGKRHFP